MGDLSEHFNHRDFACQCPECKGAYRIHLGLVGILELIASHFHKKPKILAGYFCEAYSEKLAHDKPSWHSKGKAANIALDGISAVELFKFAETIEGVNGLGFYPEENMIHIDTRPPEKKEVWIKEKGNYLPLTANKRNQYGL
ncbi:MAG: YcbK family protein [Candidatus Margulisiibacteriota bacterium]